MLSLPTTEYPFGTVEIPLEGQVYIFEYRWNSRTEAWYLSVDLDTERLISEAKIMADSSIFENYVIQHLPDGSFKVITFSDKDPLELENFGIAKDYELWFISEQDILNLEANV